MSLRAALLFVLASEPLTGYDAAKRFGATVGHMWHAADSQIYPELRRMETEGLVEGTDVPWGVKGATKRRYSITDAGLGFLETWPTVPLRYAPERDPARLRSAYFEWASAEDARAQLHAHIEHHEREIETMRSRIADIDSAENQALLRRLEHYDECDRARVRRWKVFSHEGTIERAEAEIAWAKRGLKLLEDDPEGPAEYRPRVESMAASEVAGVTG